MAAIPWKIIADITLPHLIDQASKLFRKADSSAQVVVEEPLTEPSIEQKTTLLTQRIEQLEEMVAEQAKLVHQSLEEIQKITVLAAGLQARANTAVVVSALSVASCVLAWILWR